MNFGQPIVLDLGTYSSKVGFAGQQQPNTRLLTKHRQSKSQLKSFNQSNQYQIQNDRSLKQFMKRGIIENFDFFEDYIQNIYSNIMKKQSNQHPLLITQHIRNPKSNIQQITEILFQKMNCPKFHRQFCGLLSLYSSGRTDGIIVDVGHSVTQTFCSYQGYIISHACLRSDIGGFDITDKIVKYLSNSQNQYLKKNYYQFPYIAESIKETNCFVFQNYFQTIQTNINYKGQQKSIYVLPDGSNLQLQKELFQAPSIVFNPINKSKWGILDMIQQSVKLCDLDVKKTMMTNIVMSGAPTLMTGFGSFIHSILSKRTNLNIKVIQSQGFSRSLNVWIGGSILASLSYFQNMYVSKQEYLEHGVSIIHRKFQTI